jgi:nucleoside-diphosphate-sugar epimerase
VERVTIDREQEERTGSFGDTVARLQPDVVIDMICFTPESARHLVEALRNKVGHILVCGTVWIHGYNVTVPTLEHESLNAESQRENPYGEYGFLKAEMTEYLLSEVREHQLPATVIHPGHIVGPGWEPVNPLGNFNTAVFETLAKGDRVLFPNLGLETLHHVHADDVAQMFVRALRYWKSAIGEDFHAVSEHAVTMRGYAETVASWFGKEPDLVFSAGDEWKKGLSEEDIETTLAHIQHSSSCSIEKAMKLLGYRPRYTSMEAVYESLMWLIGNGEIKL